MKPSWNNDNHSNDTTAAFNRALKYLSLRARSKKEIEEYLTKKKFEQGAISQAVEKLIELKFLNDEVYAESFTRTRQEYKGKSKYFIKYELQQKGLSQDIIEKVLGSSQEDLQTARDFIARKKRIYVSLDKKEFKEKIMRLLTTRGFSFDIIKKALEED